MICPKYKNLNKYFAVLCTESIWKVIGKESNVIPFGKQHFTNRYKNAC